jgi:hypothetical protein
MRISAAGLVNINNTANITHRLYVGGSAYADSIQVANGNASIDWIETSTSTITFSGAIPSTPIELNFVRNGRTITVMFRDLNVTTNTPNQRIIGTAIPTQFRPVVEQYLPFMCKSDSNLYHGAIRILTTGVFEIMFPDSPGMVALGHWTSGVSNSGFYPQTIAYTNYTIF